MRRSTRWVSMWGTSCQPSLPDQLGHLGMEHPIWATGDISGRRKPGIWNGENPCQLLPGHHGIIR